MRTRKKFWVMYKVDWKVIKQIRRKTSNMVEKYNLGITWVSQKFCNILVVRGAQFGSFRCFCHRSCKDDEPRWTVRFQDTFRVLLSVFTFRAWIPQF